MPYFLIASKSHRSQKEDMVRNFFASLALAAILTLSSTMPCNAAGSVPDGSLGVGYSAIVNVPKSTESTTFHGLTLAGSILFAGHHAISIETGFYVGDQGIYETRGGWRNRENYSRDTYLTPLLISYNFVQEFAMGNFFIQGGPMGGIFIATGYETWNEYDHNLGHRSFEGDGDGDESGWRVKDSHAEGDVFWGAGAQVSASVKLSNHFYLSLAYRVFYASSYEVFGIKTGNSTNHQLSLTGQFRF
jgi:hypothetical protein